MSESQDKSGTVQPAPKPVWVRIRPHHFSGIVDYPALVQGLDQKSFGFEKDFPQDLVVHFPAGIHAASEYCRTVRSILNPTPLIQAPSNNWTTGQLFTGRVCNMPIYEAKTCFLHYTLVSPRPIVPQKLDCIRKRILQKARDTLQPRYSVVSVNGDAEVLVGFVAGSESEDPQGDVEAHPVWGGWLCQHIQTFMSTTPSTIAIRLSLTDTAPQDLSVNDLLQYNQAFFGHMEIEFEASEKTLSIRAKRAESSVRIYHCWSSGYEANVKGWINVSVTL